MGYLPSVWHRDPAPGNAALLSALAPHGDVLRPAPVVRPDWPGWERALHALVEQGAAAIRAYPMHWGWVDVDEVVAVLRDRPGTQHVVITGRNAPEKLVEFADLVTDMSKVKHPMDAGQKGQRGIEW